VDSPEWSYLQHGLNGLELPDLGENLITALLRLEGDPAERERLAAGALRYAQTELSPERQVQGFAEALAFVLPSRPVAPPALRSAVA
jgi:hypothetical protein